MALVCDALTATPRAHNAASVAPLVATTPGGAAQPPEGTAVQWHDARAWPTTAISGYQGTQLLAEQAMPVHALGSAAAHEAVQVAAVLAATNAVGNGCVRAAAWRASTLLQSSHWLCENCEIACANDVDACPRCGTQSAISLRMTQQWQRAQLHDAVQASAYGQRLVFAAGTQQHDGVPACVGMFGSANFESVVADAVDDLGTSTLRRDRREYLPDGVVSFDGYLALETRSRYTVQTKEGVVALQTSGRAVALLNAYMTLFASHTTARAIDGVVRLRVSKPHTSPLHCR